MVLASLPSCDKARDLLRKAAEKAASASKSPSAATAHAGALVSEIGEAEYEAFTQQPGRLVLIDYYADWCGPCRQLAPILEKITAEQNGRVVVGKVNVDKTPALAAKAGVQGIPDVRIFRDGKQVDRFVGLPPEVEVRQRIENQLKNLAGPPAAGEKEPAKPAAAEPPIQPMSKDWLPPGMQRR